MSTQTPESAGLTRRQVTKAAAWAAPVVAVAVAAPLASASGGQPPLPTANPSQSSFAGGIGIQAYREPDEIYLNENKTLTFNVSLGRGQSAPAGTYSGGWVQLVVGWSPIQNSTVGYSVSEISLNGWTRVGSLPASGTTGTVTYQYPSIVNGVPVDLPLVALIPIGGVLGSTKVSSDLSGQYIGTSAAQSDVLA